ncbi:MAG: DUF4286 family protein [Sneathiellaceae bacterium]
MFWAVIKCNLVDPETADAFNAWYNASHAPRYIRQPAFRRGWRLERLDHAAQRGDPGQRYQAIYEVDAVADFNAALDRDHAESHPWEDWETRIRDWQRTYYRLLGARGGPRPPAAGQGGFWSVERVDLQGLDAAGEAEFNRWSDARHLPALAAAPGVRRAWRLKLEPDANDLGPRGQAWLTICEADAADSLAVARDGAPLHDGLWAGHVRALEIGICRKLYDHESPG